MAYTNAEGRFEIGPLSKGAHDVVFDAKFGRGEAFESLVLPGVAAPTDSLRIVLPSRGRLTLRILFDEAARPSGGMVEINGPAGEARWNTGAPLRADGKVDVGLPSDVAGDVSIGVRGFESVRRRVVASSGANVDLGDVRLRRGATLAGVLRAYDGRPAPNVEVLADVSSSKRSVKTDASGAFQIDGLPSGTVRVESPAGPWGPATAFRVGLPLTEDLVLALPRPGLLSMVLLDRSGAPRPRGAVVFRDAGGEPMSVGSDRADERGRFEASLGPGVYTVEADGFPAETVEVREDDVTFLRLREP